MKLSDLEIHIETACNNAYRRVWRPEVAKDFIIQKFNEYIIYLNKIVDSDINIEEELKKVKKNLDNIDKF